MNITKEQHGTKLVLEKIKKNPYSDKENEEKVWDYRNKYCNQHHKCIVANEISLENICLVIGKVWNNESIPVYLKMQSI